MGAKKKPLETKSAGDVGIEADRVGFDTPARPLRASSTRRRPRPAGEIIEDEDTNETVEKIVAWLDERKLICA